MKRLVALLLILAVLVPAVGSAELPSPDYRKWRKLYLAFGQEELFEANKALQDILFENAVALDGVKVYPGIYIVGEDIPAGTYKIDFPELGETSVGTFCLYEGEEDLIHYSILSLDSGVYRIGKLEMKDGMRVEISKANAVFYTYTGLFN